MLVPGSIPNIIFSKSFKGLSFKSIYKNTFFISLILFVIAILFIGSKFSEHQLLFIKFKQYFSVGFLPYLFLLFLLQIINWSIEALKFKLLMDKYHSLSFLNSLKAVYAGNFTALITPERIGNFIGRAVILKTNKKLITLLTVFGNSCQLLVTLSMGLIGFYSLLIYDFNIHFLNSVQLIFGLIIYTFLFFIVCSSVFNLKWINLFIKMKFLSSWHKNLNLLKDVLLNTKFSILGLCFSRYFIFILQYYLLILAFDLTIDFLQLTIYLGLLFGMVTLIPSLVPGNLGTKEALCILLFGGGVLGIQFSLISFIVWLINVGLSGFIGSLVLLMNKKSR